MRPASETEWCGERKGRVVTSAALAGRRPEIEWILVHSSASSKERGGRIVAIRFASMVFPEPGGPTRSRLCSEYPLLFLPGRVGLQAESATGAGFAAGPRSKNLRR